MNELRVLMIAPTPFFSDRGCHVRILEEIRALQTRNAKILLITYPNGDEVDGVDTERPGGWTGYRKAEAGPHPMKPFLDALLCARAMRVSARFKPHIIHGHLHEGCLVGAAVARYRRVPLVFDYQGSFAKEFAHHGTVRDGNAPFKILSAVESFINSLPDAILPSSGVFRQDFAKSDVPIFPVHDAINPDEFKVARDSELSSELRIGKGRFVVAFLGLLNAYQGVDLLLDVVAELKRAGREKFLFLIMGYPDVDKYEAMARDLGLTEMVRFTGRIAYKDAPRYLALGDAAAAPKIAVTESNGKVIDYMACGLPAVAFDTPVNRELMGDAGLLVPWDGDEKKGAAAMAEAFIELAGNAALREELKRKGLERVRAKFSRSSLADRLIEVYSKALGDKMPAF